ncbi:MAG: nicotinamide mononucleotide transporter [Clostridia bacterium]|nr:nicotinamide mononucleotide transporter [Clostridia bacterium]
MINYLEIGATIFGLIQGVLVMLNKRSNWIAYSIQMILMIIFSLTMHLYGDVVNSSIYLVLGIIGFIIWNRKDEKDIKKCSAKEKLFYISLIGFATMVGFLILNRTDDPLPLLDAFTTVSSFVATYYMMTKRIDTWFIWFINDIFYAIEYFILPEQALSLFILNVLWTVMAVFSYFTWRKIMKEGVSND